MLAWGRFIFTRFASALVTLFIITAILYAIVMMTPPETRAELYMSRGGGNPYQVSEEQRRLLIEHIIERYGLNDPYPVQYARWLINLVQGQWGYSNALSANVLDFLLERTPITVELMIYSLLFLIPFGLVSGAIAGWRRNRPPDILFRLSAFTATYFPPFILALIFLSVFYVSLHWFPTGRLGDAATWVRNSPGFTAYTGLLTIDGLLNGHFEVSIDAARHLVLPVLTLSLIHWATLGRVVRASTIDELQKEYILAAKSRGLSDWAILWRHSFPNVISPALASSALSAASLITGVFIVERLYNLHGVSDMVVNGLLYVADAPTALGYTLYNVIAVQIIMLALDILRGVVDPRTREGWITQ